MEEQTQTNRKAHNETRPLFALCLCLLLSPFTFTGAGAHIDTQCPGNAHATPIAHAHI
jgi:hypothetical protein